MKKKMATFGGIPLLGMLVASSTMAQQGGGGRGGGGWGPGTSYGRMYDVNTIESIRGDVLAVERFTPTGMSAGIHLQVKTRTETLFVHLGPEWYIDRQDVQIAVKDTIEVKGSRISFQGKPAIIAAEVKKGDEVLVLRDESGLPAWSAMRRR